MKASRLNLIPSVRRGLLDNGFSTVKVVSAVNAALGELALASETQKSGDGNITKDGYKVTNTVAFKYEGKRTLPLMFDAWHSAQAKAAKIAEMEVVSIPPIFNTWLEKFAKGAKEELNKEVAEMVPSGISEEKESEE